MEGNTKMSRYAYEQREKLGDPGTDAIGHLRHTVKAFAGVTRDDEWVIRATGNIYGEGVTTGMTWGDLRAILAIIDALPTGTEAHPAPGGARQHTIQMAGAFSDYLAQLMDNMNEPQEARAAYHTAQILPRGRSCTRLIKASAEVLYVFSEYAESLLNLHDDASESEIRGARKWLKDMSDRGL